MWNCIFWPIFHSSSFKTPICQLLWVDQDHFDCSTTALTKKDFRELIIIHKHHKTIKKVSFAETRWKVSQPPTRSTAATVSTTTSVLRVKSLVFTLSQGKHGSCDFWQMHRRVEVGRDPLDIIWSSPLDHGGPGPCPGSFGRPSRRQGTPQPDHSLKNSPRTFWSLPT